MSRIVTKKSGEITVEGQTIYFSDLDEVASAEVASLLLEVVKGLTGIDYPALHRKVLVQNSRIDAVLLQHATLYHHIDKLNPIQV